MVAARAFAKGMLGQGAGGAEEVVGVMARSTATPNSQQKAPTAYETAGRW